MKKFLSLLLVLFTVFSLFACGEKESAVIDEEIVKSDNSYVELLSTEKRQTPHGEYNEGVVLVKSDNFNEGLLGNLKFKEVKQLYIGSKWYEVVLDETVSTTEAIDYLLELNTFEKVDYDYIMMGDGTIESIDVSNNPQATEQGYLDTQGIFDGWGYAKANNKTPGGSPDVVVAIIDTGVDYNHIDLRNNIWINTVEIPDNGIDDDGNGYVDDYRGWNCVGDNNNPMDDNGHGTHVAGIVAAENNLIGTVGVAFNCKVMCIKAGNSSGYFNNSDIAEAIQYAYMNGASVINMSFGGSSISFAVEEALENAYNQCVLVAAAGNSGACNNLKHSNRHIVGVSYPAALSYVIGVMSTNYNGTVVSSFSNYDDTPYNSIEYEVYACGEQVPSTWPNNKFAKLSGTSMAAPVVSGIAALLRSYLTDRDVYSNKYIQSQIVNTSEINPYNVLLESHDLYHSFANIYDAIMKTPKPSVNLYNYYIFDNKEFDSSNNGNGIIDAGETIHLAIELYNRGGVASNVTATIDTIRNNDPSLTDPYFNIINETINLSDIGTYSIRNCEKIYDDEENVLGTVKYFEIKITDDCPNDYLANFNIHISYKNGMNDNDLINYSRNENIELVVTKGVLLPEVISEDMTLTSDKLYIIPFVTTIESGVTVTIEAGTNLQFYYPSESFLNGDVINPTLINYGTLKFNGNHDSIINIYVSEFAPTYYPYNCQCTIKSMGDLYFYYTNVQDLYDISCDGVFIAESCNFSSTQIHLRKAENKKIQSCFFKETVLNVEHYDYNNSNNNASFILQENLLVSSYFYFFCDFRYAPTTFNIDNNYISNTNGFDLTLSEYGHCINSTVHNNIFESFELKSNCWLRFDFRRINDSSEFSTMISIKNNKLIGVYKNYKSNGTIDGYRSSETGHILFDIEEATENLDFSNVWPHIEKIELFDSQDNVIKTVGNETFRVVATFNRDMDTNEIFNLLFGTRNPYADYLIHGKFISPRVWEGEYTIKALIENGTQYFRVAGIKDLEGKEVYDNGYDYSFDIDTSSAQSMNLSASSSENGINLEWAQDDYDTLMGYNIYRSTEKDGYYTKLNSSIIPSNENTFVDENAEPGVKYWYTFTVVLSDMTESSPAGKVSCAALDTIAPSVYHTPINQGYLNNNLVISCTASDNIAISNVTLYYRSVGENSWKQLQMSKQNDRYSATIFGSDLSLDGLEYYIVASDGVNTISKGSDTSPYSVLIKDASSISRLGDVDGDGIVTTKDALMIMQSINGDLLLSDDEFRRADLNKDGILSSVEALRILQFINGNVTTLEM